MVLITIVTGALKPTYNWGASHSTKIQMAVLIRMITVKMAISCTMKNSLIHSCYKWWSCFKNNIYNDGHVIHINYYNYLIMFSWFIEYGLWQSPETQVVKLCMINKEGLPNGSIGCRSHKFGFFLDKSTWIFIGLVLRITIEEAC